MTIISRYEMGLIILTIIIPMFTIALPLSFLIVTGIRATFHPDETILYILLFVLVFTTTLIFMIFTFKKIDQWYVNYLLKKRQEKKA